MEKFKEQIQKRIRLLSIFLVIVLLLTCFEGFSIVQTGEGTVETGRVMGFQAGLLFGMAMIALMNIVKLRNCLKDDKKLKLLQHEEQDERKKLIRSKAGMPMLLINSILILLAAIIAGHINMTVFYTLICVAMGQLLIGVGLKLYYSKTI